MATKTNKTTARSQKPEVSKEEFGSQKPEVGSPTSDLRPLTSDCIAFTHGHHACKCGGALCGDNVTS